MRVNLITIFRDKINELNDAFNRADSETNTYGSNGYDNRIMETHTVLLARGPAFKNGTTLPLNLTFPVNAVDIMPLVAHVLGVRSYPTAWAGRINNLLSILAEPPGGMKPMSEMVHHAVDFVTSPEHLPLTGIIRN